MCLSIDFWPYLVIGLIRGNWICQIQSRSNLKKGSRSKDPIKICWIWGSKRSSDPILSKFAVFCQPRIDSKCHFITLELLLSDCYPLVTIICPSPEVVTISNICCIDIRALTAAAAKVHKTQSIEGILSAASKVLVLRMAHRKWKAKHVAWPSWSWLLLSFFPYPVGRPEHEHCTVVDEECDR